MKTATSVSFIQRHIAINVVSLVEFYGGLCSLFYWIYFTVELKRTLESSNQFHRTEVVLSCFKPLISKEKPVILHKIELAYMPQLFNLLTGNA